MTLNSDMGTGPLSLCTKSRNLMQGTVDFTEDVRRQRMASLCPEKRKLEIDKKAGEINWPVEAGCLMVESPKLSPS